MIAVVMLLVSGSVSRVHPGDATRITVCSVVGGRHELPVGVIMASDVAVVVVNVMRGMR